MCKSGEATTSGPTMPAAITAMATGVPVMPLTYLRDRERNPGPEAAENASRWASWPVFG